MKIVKAEEKEWTEGKGYSKKILFSEKELEAPNLLQIVKTHPKEKVAPHYHKHTKEIFYILKGNCIIFIGNDKTRRKPGDVMLCEPGDVHGVINDTDEDLVTLVFKINPTKNDIYWVEK